MIDISTLQFIHYRCRESHAIADGKMSYAEAVADTKLNNCEHPLLEEAAWSSPDSETGSSSGVNDDDKNQASLYTHSDYHVSL